MTATAHLIVMQAVATALRAYTGYRDPKAAGSATPVYLGTQSALHGDIPTDSVTIGWVDAESPGSLGRAKQDPAAGGSSRWRAEVGEIACRATSTTGNNRLAAHEEMLTAVYAHLDAVDAVIRGAVNGPTLGLVPVPLSLLVVQFGSVDAVRPSLDAGPQVALDFTLTYLARLSL